MIQINDTHPALVIPELMRILIDEEGLPWEDAWNITTKTVAYTNHTIMVEALEKWPIDMVKTLLPRIYTIIEEINRRFCSEMLERTGGDWQKVCNVAIIHDGQINMAHLAVIGSSSVNGVSKLHTEILKNEVLKCFTLYTLKSLTAKQMVLHTEDGLLKQTQIWQGLSLKLCRQTGG